MADMEPVQILSTPPFSSNDPETDGLTMLPIDDNPPADEFPVEELTEEEIAAGEPVEPRYVPIEDTAGVGEGATAPEEDMSLKAGDWVAEIEATDTQEELDAVLQRYAATGKTFATVTAAAESKQAEIDAANA